MATYPYNPALGGLVRAIEQFRKNFPSTVDSALLKRFGIAAANESYVINTLRFVGFIDDEGNRIEEAVAPFYGSPEDFESGMERAVKVAYADLFNEYGEEAWAVERTRLVTWFRQKDKTSEVIGGRQAGTFIALAGFSGHGEVPKAGVTREATAATPATSKPSARPKPRPKDTNAPTTITTPPQSTAQPSAGADPFGLSVRIEVNLPANASPETYDAIFASIRKNLIERG